MDGRAAIGMSTVRATARAAATMAAALVLMLAGACTYSPAPADGTLACSLDGKCPDGYSCSAGVCRKKGGGGGGNGGSLQQRYLGTWVFTANSSIVTVCTGGPTTDTMEGELVHLVADPSGQGAIQTTDPCALSLTLDASSGTRLADSTPFCSGSDDTFTYTWEALTFDFFASSTTAATLDSDYDVVITDAAQAVVDTCTQRVMGSLNKVSASALTASAASAPDPGRGPSAAYRRRLR
jgi:hypothetical protein